GLAVGFAELGWVGVFACACAGACGGAGFGCGFTLSFETVALAGACLWWVATCLRAAGFFAAGFDFVAISKKYSWLKPLEPSPLLVSHPVCGRRREFHAPLLRPR